MGFDLHGMNPQGDTPEPEWTKGDPYIKTGDSSYTIDPQIKEEYDDYTKSKWEWQESTGGAYFRNNVWAWRPLWNFVTGICNDILTEKDMEAGSWNDGHKISKTKATRIANRLLNMIEDGSVKEYEEGHKKHLASLNQVDCDICGATGRRNKPPKSGAGDYMECNGCNGTGKVDDWAKSYPFSEDNVREFANFCLNSGGFQIW